MDTRYQPESLSFANNNFNNENIDVSRKFRVQSEPLQYQNFSRSTQRQDLSRQAPQQPAPLQYGLPSGPRASLPRAGQQMSVYSRMSNTQQQQQQQQYQGQPGSTQSPAPGYGDTTRSTTWVQTPADSYPVEQGYFTGPVDANGYPIDVKVPEPKNPFEDLPPRSAPAPREVASPIVDAEKQDHHHDGWTYHEKIPHRKDPNQPYLSFGERLRHFTWAWYTLTMATGGIATLISIQPHPFPGLITIGAIFFIMNLVFFFGITGTMALRFIKFPGSFKVGARSTGGCETNTNFMSQASITHEREGLFLGPFFLSVATIITGTQKYIIQAYEASHPNRSWAVTSIAVAFWAYTFLTFCLAVFQYSFLFCFHTYKLTSFMPSWLLPIFPIMLSGTIASVIAADQPMSSRMPIIVAGLGCQGLGFTVAILMYAHYIGRLMQVGYPGREHRGAMFIGVGPPSFTCLALIGMANALPDDFDLQGDGLVDAKLLRTMALVVALFLWVLAMWFFMITLVAVSTSNVIHLGLHTDARSGHPSMGALLPSGLVGHGVPKHRIHHRHNLDRQLAARRDHSVRWKRSYNSRSLHVGVCSVQPYPSSVRW